MDKPKISIIVAIDKKRGIGKDNGLLWHIPLELKHFREITTGHPIIMGRKTYESIGRPLPNRTNIIVTRDSEFTSHHPELRLNRSELVPESSVVAGSLEEAINEAEKVLKSAGVNSIHPGGGNRNDEIFIIGGGQIYSEALKMGVVDKLYVTIVSGSFEPTVFFPEYENLFTKKVFEKEIEVEGTKDGNLQTFKIKFKELERRK